MNQLFSQVRPLATAAGRCHLEDVLIFCCMHPRLHSEGPRTPSKRESESLDSTVTDTAESLTSSIVFVFVLLEIHAINEVPDKNILSVYKQTINGRVILSTASKKDRQTDSIAKPI